MITRIDFPSVSGHYSLVAGIGYLGGSVVTMMLPHAAVSATGAAFFGIVALTIMHIAKHTLEIEWAACFGVVVGYAVTVNHGYNLSVVPLVTSYVVGAIVLHMLKRFIAAN